MNKKEAESVEKVLGMLDRVVAKIEGMHSDAQDFGTGISIYRSEIHTIQAIGKNPKTNVTQIAKIMGVTKGAISQTLTRLAQKGLIQKLSTNDNRKETIVELTDLGWVGYHNHENLHLEMHKIVEEYFGSKLEKKMKVFIELLSDIEAITRKLEKKSM